jgi:hypothetical protein
MGSGRVTNTLIELSAPAGAAAAPDAAAPDAAAQPQAADAMDVDAAAAPPAAEAAAAPKKPPRRNANLERIAALETQIGELTAKAGLVDMLAVQLADTKVQLEQAKLAQLDTLVARVARLEFGE